MQLKVSNNLFGTKTTSYVATYTVMIGRYFSQIYIDFSKLTWFKNFNKWAHLQELQYKKELKINFMMHWFLYIILLTGVKHIANNVYLLELAIQTKAWKYAHRYKQSTLACYHHFSTLRTSTLWKKKKQHLN